MKKSKNDAIVIARILTTGRAKVKIYDDANLVTKSYLPNNIDSIDATQESIIEELTTHDFGCFQIQGETNAARLSINYEGKIIAGLQSSIVFSPLMPWDHQSVQDAINEMQACLDVAKMVSGIFQT